MTKVVFLWKVLFIKVAFPFLFTISITLSIKYFLDMILHDI